MATLAERSGKGLARLWQGFGKASNALKGAPALDSRPSEGGSCRLPSMTPRDFLQRLEPASKPARRNPVSTPAKSIIQMSREPVITWTDALDRYEKWLVARGMRPRSVVGYMREIGYVKDFLAKRPTLVEPGAVTLADLREYQLGLLTGENCCDA